MEFLAKDIYEKPPVVKSDCPFKVGDKLACLYGKGPLVFKAFYFAHSSKPGLNFIRIDVGTWMPPDDFYEVARFSDDPVIVNLAHNSPVF